MMVIFCNLIGYYAKRLLYVIEDKIMNQKSIIRALVVIAVLIYAVWAMKRFDREWNREYPDYVIEEAARIEAGDMDPARRN